MHRIILNFCVQTWELKLTYGIGFLCSYMQTEANVAVFDIKSVKHDFESWTSKVVRQIRNAYTRAHYLIKKVIGLCDIELLCSNMPMEPNRAIYNITSKNCDFESRTSKLVRQIRKAHTRVRYLIKKFIGASYDIEFLCSNMRIALVYICVIRIRIKCNGKGNKLRC